MNEESGYLTVSVNTAKGSFPIEGATVRIYSEGFEPLYTFSTDSSGRTPAAELPAPPLSASQTPDTGVVPYARYTIDTEYPGYYTVENINAPVYPGVLSLQNVSMIPRSVGILPYEDTRFNESPAPDL